MSERMKTPMPKLMRSLEKDERGYPIPFLVLRDKSGQPQFTINDHTKARQCVTKRLCAICGKRMSDGYWFVGGIRCFLHEFGAFIDPPLHYECAEYALKVCPFLALPSYTKRIDSKKLKPENVPENTALIENLGVPPFRPTLFGLGMTAKYNLKFEPNGSFIFTVNDWLYVEWWQNGQRQLAPETGIAAPLEEVS